MHAPLSFQITVRCFGVWRWGCCVLILLAALTTACWAAAAWSSHPGWLAFSVLLGVGAVGGVLLHAWHLAPTSLRWDGQFWHLGPAATIGQEPQVGSLTVMMDLGVWILLRFVVNGARGGVWLPVQRRGHEPGWHGLRATVYCARPVFPPATTPF
jgi:hypothetical protein